MKRSIRRSAAAAVLACGLSFVAPAARAVPLLNGFGGPSGYGEQFLPRNDDGSTSELPLPFELDFYGTTYSSFWVNNNGNVTFTGPLSSYTPDAFPGAPRPMLAPWWADVDTRNIGSDVVYFTAPNADTMVVTWPNVGYYNSQADKLNSFQLVIQRTPGDTSGAFTAQYRYESLSWTTGSASGGSGGLGGTPAVAGYDAGDDENFFMLPGSRTGAVLDVQNSSNVSAETPGLWQFFFGPDGEAPGSTPENPLLPVVVDGSFFFSFPVQPAQRYFIDPPVAIGYDYTVEGVPNFASVIAPILPADSLFDLYTSSDSCATYSDFVTQLTGNVEYTFATPQSCFSIRDIALAANLDPTNTTAFVTGITFDAAGMVNVTQTPITQNVDNGASVPGPLPLLGAAAAFRWSRRLRRRLLIATQQ
ncbi:MAG: nidogen-like domain-containing protein [Cyanobacteriota bacterium]